MVTHGDSHRTHGDSDIVVHSKMVVINLNCPSALIVHSKIVVINNIWLPHVLGVSVASVKNTE